MLNLKTNEALLEALKNSRNPTAEELRNQRISFILGSLDEKSAVTRADVVRILAAQEGNPEA